MDYKLCVSSSIAVEKETNMNERKLVCFVKFPLTEITFLLMENSLFESFVYSHNLHQEAFALRCKFPLSFSLLMYNNIFHVTFMLNYNFHRKNEEFTFTS